MASDLESEDPSLSDLSELLDLDDVSVLKLGCLFAQRYHVEERLGYGGMGCVYRATDNQTKQTVALKVLHSTMLSDAGARRRFIREGRASIALKHPHIVQVTDFSIATDGLPYMVMEYLEGQSLADILIKSGPLTLARFITSFSQILSALTHAHEQGIVHRDIKPSNIMFVPTSRGRENIKLVDFGVAKLVTDMGGTQELTTLGELIGSPCYMSPEQCQGDDVDIRSDLYSLGCVMYEALTGARAFRGGSSLRIMHKQVHEMPPSFSKIYPDHTIPLWLEQLIFKTLAKNPADRYENAHALKIELLDGRFHPDEESTAAHFAVLPWESLRGTQFDDNLSGSFQALPKAPPIGTTTNERIGGASTLAVGTISNPQVFKSFNWAVLKLLNDSGILGDEDLNNARDFQTHNGGDMTKILVLLGKIDNHMLAAAQRAQQLLELGEVSQDRALALLAYCQKTGLGLDKAAKELLDKK